MEGIEDFYPLSPAQQGILFHSLYAPKTNVYFQQVGYHLRGELNVAAFRRAWRQVLNRHPVLRSGFVWGSVKEPVQVVHRRVELPLEEHDWRHMTDAERASRVGAHRWAEQEHGLNLSKPPLMRLALMRLSDDEYWFLWGCHHILLDGWSRLLVSREVMSFYAAYSSGRDLRVEPARPYRDYIVWLRRQGLASAEAFWRETLRGFTSGTPLGIESGRDELPDEEEGYSEQQLQLSEAATASLVSVARSRRLTLNTVVQGAWAFLLSRYSGSNDVVFGNVVSGRPPELAGVENMIGLFVNTLPARARVPPRGPLMDWLRGLQEREAEARRYEHAPLTEIHRWSEVAAGEPLFRSIYAFENYPAQTFSTESGGITLSVESSFERTNYPLTIMVAPGRELALRALYDWRHVSDEAVGRLMEHFRILLENIAADPDQDLSTFSFMTKAEREHLVDDFNADL